MGTLTSHIDILPPILKDKYSSAFWVAKGNEILEKLSGEKLMRDLTYRRGVIVDKSVWITPPSNYRHVVRLHDPENYDMQYPFIETDGKILLTDDTVTEEEDPDTADTFSDYALDSITVNIDELEEDDYKDHLFVITAGTLANETAIIRGNDASSGGLTKLYFTHNTTSLLDATKVTAASIIDPDYYLVLIFNGSYTGFSTVGDEVPIDDDFEKRIMNTGLMFKGYERLYGVNDRTTGEWERKFNTVVQELRNEFLSKTAQVRARVWAGLADDSDLDDEGEHGK